MIFQKLSTLELTRRCVVSLAVRKSGALVEFDSFQFLSAWQEQGTGVNDRKRNDEPLARANR